MFLRSFKRFFSFLRPDYFQESKMGEVLYPDYEESINLLNKLQSNVNALKTAGALDAQAGTSSKVEKLQQVRKYLFRSGLSPDDLNSLPVLHVTGTKGKGSTCAFTESILRHHGYKTGFFSSPHLIEVRERIRMNGVPILKDTFAKTFWNIYQNLDRQKERPEDLPFYFQFLFIMAVHIFLQQKVDVAIIEVGIGGEYDPTNIFTNVPVAGITSLGYDHTSVLGNTIESISWNKAGIMKKGSKVFTVPQPNNAHDVLHERSIERQCSLTVVKNECHIPQIQKHPPSIQSNINLAIRMSEAWMLLCPIHNNNTFMDMDILKNAIQNCVWPGRYEIRQERNLRYFIDGAHTLESIELCVNWYLNEIRNQKEKRALIFNLTGGRPCEEFFKLLSKCQFDTVIFVPNVATQTNNNADSLNLVLPVDQQLTNCNTYKEKWLNLISEDQDVQVYSSVQEAADYLNNVGPYNVLLTGSLHLVGAVISLINPNLYELLKD